jgi:hypothetical protein
MDIISSILQPLLAMLGAKFGILGIIGAYGIAFVPVMTILIELLQFIVSLTASKTDDELAAKIVTVWQTYVLPVLEVFPHANIPLSATMLKVMDYMMRAVSAIKGAISGWQNPPAPPAPPASGSSS